MTESDPFRHFRLFYEFRLDEAVPNDHLVRKIGALLDLSWVYMELAPYYSDIGRPSIDPVLMIRMLIIGYVFAIRSERQICREVQVNLAYRWFCDLGLEDAIPLPLISLIDPIAPSNGTLMRSTVSLYPGIFFYRQTHPAVCKFY
jgi:hypothetical protein